MCPQSPPSGSRWNSIGCHICHDLVDDTEKWIEKNIGKDEAKIVSRCNKFFEFFHAEDMAKRFCQDLLEHGIDVILKRLDDPEQEKKDAAAVCGDLHICPQF
uniref:Saposin B-type domain-containing protein n=1 Tax=Steinernema glaseri TaxID=37863 RepID=A0A1I8A9M1_9BILA